MNIEIRNLFKKGNFTAHSGNELSWKIDCDALTDEDLDTLAYHTACKVKFKEVNGVPRGGLRLAKALGQYCTSDLSTNNILIVDDVLTTGNSMEDILKGMLERGDDSNTVYIGYVIFSRIKNPAPWIKSIFYME